MKSVWIFIQTNQGTWNTVTNANINMREAIKKGFNKLL